MLNKGNRLRKSEQFSQVLRYGKRSGNEFLAVNYCADQLGNDNPLVGLVVSKRAMKNAVDRNRVKRQLRAIMAKNINVLPQKSAIVIRVFSKSKNVKSDILEKKLLRTIKKASEN